MPKIDLDSAPMKSGSIYPEPFASQMAGRTSLRLGDAGGLSQFGANIVIRGTVAADVDAALAALEAQFAE